MNLRYFLISWGGAIVLLYLIFSSTITVPYVRHDSIRYFHKFYNKAMDAPTNPQRAWEFAVGRPLLAELEGHLYKHINHLSDMSRLRMAVIFIFSLSAALLTTIVVSMGIDAVAAFCLIMAMFTLPGCQEIIFVPFFSLGVSILLTVFAYALWRSRLMFFPRVILTIGLLEIVFFMYPPAAPFFLIPVMFAVVFKTEDWPNVRKTVIADTVLCAGAALLCLVIIRVFFYVNLQDTGHQINLGMGYLLANLKTFVPRCALQVFNLWNIYYSMTLGVLMALFVLIVLAADCLWPASLIKWQRLLFIAGLFLVFNVIWFMFGGYLPRTFMAAQGSALIMVFWCVEWVRKALAVKIRFLALACPVFFMLAGAVSANTTTIRNVFNSNAELMFMRNRLAQYASTSIKQIHVIRPRDLTKGYNGYKIAYDNFNAQSLDDYEIPDFIRVALKDMDDPPTEMHCIVTSSNYGEPLTGLSPYSVVIDMNDLVRASRKE